ncbi:hypothetical protein ACFW24_38400 [Streptomyces nigra]|uniref:hypothetical protein n=1 Tax=Streptomyces nigra TaxID=1827580 RepID=UPI0036C054D0
MTTAAIRPFTTLLRVATTCAIVPHETKNRTLFTFCPLKPGAALTLEVFLRQRRVRRPQAMKKGDGIWQARLLALASTINYIVVTLATKRQKADALPRV